MTLPALVLAAALLALPTAAWANVGTPLVWLQMSHLAVGNLLIGLGEGIVLWVAFRARLPLACGVMVTANYASAMAGMLLLVSMSVLFGAGGRPLYGILGPTPLYGLERALWLCGALVVAFTVLLEWPFCARALAPRKRLAAISLAASLVVNALSYAALAPLYRRASDMSLLHQVRRDPSLPASSPNKGWVTFEGPEGASRIRLDGTGLERLPAASTDQAVSGAGPGTDLRPEGQRTCKVRAYQVFAHGALVVEGSGGPLRLALETPFYQWRVGKPIVLPSDQVVYECGPQIVLLDIPTRRIAFLARGRSPVVVLDR